MLYRLWVEDRVWGGSGAFSSNKKVVNGLGFGAAAAMRSAWSSWSSSALSVMLKELIAGL